MDAATLYMLYTFNKGPVERFWGDFESVDVCERYVEKFRSDKMSVVRHVCTTVYRSKTDGPLWWQYGVRTEGVINGVPLEPKHRPAAGAP